MTRPAAAATFCTSRSSAKGCGTHSHLQAAELGLDREADLVTGPHNVLGIELNEYAAELARVTVWIGELQWRLAHGYEFKTNPVLDTLEHIECRDALLTAGGGTEAAWPAADVVVGNPPFWGTRKCARTGRGLHPTAQHLRRACRRRRPGVLLVDKARAQMAAGALQRAGLVATNSIRAAPTARCSDAICAQTRIFDAWSDEPWVNDGAAVRVSLVALAPPNSQHCLTTPRVGDLQRPACRRRPSTT